MRVFKQICHQMRRNRGLRFYIVSIGLSGNYKRIKVVLLAVNIQTDFAVRRLIQNNPTLLQREWNSFNPFPLMVLILSVWCCQFSSSSMSSEPNQRPSGVWTNSFRNCSHMLSCSGCEFGMSRFARDLAQVRFALYFVPIHVVLYNEVTWIAVSVPITRADLGHQSATPNTKNENHQRKRIERISFSLKYPSIHLLAKWIWSLART